MCIVDTRTQMVSLKSVIHLVSYALTLTPLIAAPAFFATMELTHWCGKYSQACVRRKENAGSVEAEKWVPCVQATAPVLWPVKGICLNLWGDMDVPQCGWGERGHEGAGTYFKTRLFVLVRTHGDSSNTGDLSWTRPSSETWRVELHTPPWWPQGLWGWSFAQNVQSTQGWLELCFLFQLALFF